MKLYKTTITIISEYDPTGTVELSDLARDADQGDSFCTLCVTEVVESDTLESSVREFFEGASSTIAAAAGETLYPPGAEGCCDGCGIPMPMLKEDAPWYEKLCENCLPKEAV